MNSKKLLILSIIVIICVTAVCGTYIATQPLQQDTEFRVLSDQTLYKGDEVIVKLITKNETPIANQSINVTVVDANGGKNTINLVTNETGIATFKLDGVTVGNYTLDCKFGGTKYYKPTNDTFSQEIKEEVANYDTSSSESAYKTDYYFDGEYYWIDGNPYYKTNTGEYVIQPEKARQKGSRWYEECKYQDLDGDGYISLREANGGNV